jgi:hypothetical protein
VRIIDIEMTDGLPANEVIDVDVDVEDVNAGVVDVDKKYRLESQTQKDAYFKQGDLVYAPFPFVEPGKDKAQERM